MNTLTENDLTFPLEVTAIYVDCDVDLNKFDVENIRDLLDITNVDDYRFIIHDPIHGELEVRWSEEIGSFFKPIEKISKSEFMG